MANQPSELDIMLDNLQASGGVTHYLVYNREGASRRPGRRPSRVPQRPVPPARRLSFRYLRQYPR